MYGSEEAFHQVKEAEDAAAQEEAHVAPDVGDEAVEVVDEVLLLLEVGTVVHRYEHGQVIPPFE